MMQGLVTKIDAVLPENPLFRLLTINGLIGLFVAGVFVAGVFVFNIGNLRILVQQSDNPVLPVIMLACGMIITLTSVVMGTAIMMVKTRDEGPGGRRDDLPVESVLVRVEATRVRRG